MPKLDMQLHPTVYMGVIIYPYLNPDAVLANLRPYTMYTVEIMKANGWPTRVRYWWRHEDRSAITTYSSLIKGYWSAVESRFSLDRSLTQGKVHMTYMTMGIESGVLDP